MLSRSRASFVLLALLGCIAAVSQFAGSRLLPVSAFAKEQAVAQAPASADAPSETMYVIALDKDSQPITGLKMEEVRIFEDKAEQTITSLLLAVDEPLTIGLFFDVSGSRHYDRHVGEEVKLTTEFVHSIWREGDIGFVLAFSSEAFVATQPTHKLEDVDDGLSKIPDATYHGSTALYDALCILKADKLNATPGRKVYVAFSDFEDNSSRNKLEDVVELGQAAKIAIFPVILMEGNLVHSKRLEKRARDSAQRIADATGGEVSIPESSKQLRQTFEHLTSEVRAAYRINYTSSAQPGDRRGKKLRIETTRPHAKLLFAKN